MNQNQHFKSLQLKAKHQVYTLLSGNNLSKLNGEGYDFSELREYQIGDDIRKINWTVTAKMGIPYVKELHANRELSVCVVAMMTPSLNFGLKGSSVQKEKLDTLTQVSMILGYSTLYNSDIFTGIYCLNNTPYSTPPTKQIYSIDSFLKRLYKCETLGSKLDYNKVTKDIFNTLHRASLLFILGDFLQEVDLSVLAQKHEVVVIIIRHRDEESPNALGEVILQDPSSYLEINTFFGKRTIKNYISRLKQNDHRLKEHLSAYGIRYITIYTDEDIVSRLTRLWG